MSTLLPVLSLCQKCLPFSLPPLIILSSMQLTFLIYHVLVPSLSPCSRTSKQAQPNHLVRIFVQTTLYTTEFSQTLSSPGTNIRSQPFLQDPASACAPLPLRGFFTTQRWNSSLSLALIFSLNFISCCRTPFSHASHPPFLLFFKILVCNLSSLHFCSLKDFILLLQKNGPI